MKLIAFFIGATLAMGTLQAQERKCLAPLQPSTNDPMSFPVDYVHTTYACAQTVPVWRLPGAEGWPIEGKTIEDVARKMAPLISTFTARTQFEACARFCQTATGFVAQAVTVNAHVACTAPETTCPFESTPTDHTIHTHSSYPFFLGNDLDAAIWEDPTVSGKISFKDRSDEFSPQDRNAAPAWLVSGHGILWFLEQKDGQPQKIAQFPFEKPKVVFKPWRIDQPLEIDNSH